MSSLTSTFAYFVKKSADHFVDYFVGLNMVLLGLARSFLILQRSASTVEITAIRENRTAPGIISESHFLVEMMGIEPMSESIFTEISPSAVSDLRFALPAVRKRTERRTIPLFPYASGKAHRVSCMFDVQQQACR